MLLGVGQVKAFWNMASLLCVLRDWMVDSLRVGLTPARVPGSVNHHAERCGNSPTYLPWLWERPVAVIQAVLFSRLPDMRGSA